MPGALRKISNEVGIRIDVADRLRPCQHASRKDERRTRVEIHDAAQLPLADNVLNPARSAAQQIMIGSERKFVRSITRNLVGVIHSLKRLQLIVIRIGSSA